MDLTITIPTEKATEVIDLLCNGGRYQATVPDPENPGESIPNPVTANAFAKSEVLRLLKNHLKGIKHRIAEEALRTSTQQAMATIEAIDLSIT